MRFEPRIPSDDVNVTARHPLKEAAVMFLGAAAVIAALAGLGALLVDLLVPYVPPSWEARMFPDFAGVLSDRPDTERERREQEELERLFARLLAHWPEHPEEIRIGVLDEPTPNALAFPGGLVLVTRGLLDAVESENELAFVLGHELGHFRSRDHLRSLGRGLALGLLASAVSQGGSLGDLLAFSGELSGRRFNREQEQRADAFGLDLVASEFGHVAGTADFFERLPSNRGSLERSVESYLSTHPVSEERILALQRLARERGFSLEGSLTRRNFDINGR